MVGKRVAFILLLVLFSAQMVHAQVGPKDGAGLKPTDLERVKVGDTAPDFTLESQDGKRISLSEHRARKHVVLVFYRGRW